MKQINYEKALELAEKYTDRLAKEGKINLKEDEFTAIVPFENGQAIILHPENNEDGRNIKVDIRSGVFIANKQKNTVLSVFDERDYEQNYGAKNETD